MFNISNVLNSKIEVEPWRHQIVNNFFNDFELITTASKKLLEHYNNQVITADSCLSVGQVYNIIGDEVFDIIMESNRSLLDNAENIFSNFPNHRRFNQYISIPTFHILPSNLPPQKVHDEAYDKTASIVVYLYPEHSVGTAFFKTQNRDSFVRELEWKPNRAMIFCGEENVTWHDFYSKENPRITLNYFLRELTSLEIAETDTDFYWAGVSGPRTLIPKSLPVEKIKHLTSGALCTRL
jgi:hypothetical protein